MPVIPSTTVSTRWTQDDALTTWWQQCCQQHSAAPALITPHHTWSYAALDQAAQQLALRLAEQGVGAGQVVALLGERSAGALIAQLAVLRLGAAYLPLSPALPVARRDNMLAQAQPLVMCSWREPTTASAEASPDALLRLPPAATAADVPAFTLTRATPVASDPRVPPSSLVSTVAVLAGIPLYVLFTSGSSGMPKAVLGTRVGLINRLQWQWQNHPYQAQERVAARTNLAFVDAVAETWGALLAGVPLVLVPAAAAQDVDALIALVAAQQVTRITLVPTLLQALLQAAPQLGQLWPQLRYCHCSGEPLTAQLVRDFQRALPQCRLINLYGMTEAAADATAGEPLQELALADQTLVGQTSPGQVSLGQPLPGVRVVILDDQAQPLVAGEEGEICIGGEALALGYLDQPGLSAQFFIPDPDPAQYGERLYATGDYGVLNADGCLAFHGRRDHQVKVRGHRVSLLEIEHHARCHPAVGQCVALWQAAAIGGGDILLFIALAANSELTAAALRTFLQHRLADYMMPALIHIRQDLPRLYNGKIDRQQLLANSRPAVPAGSAPLTACERQLALIWQEVLRTDAPAREHSFLALGGNSLTAALVVSRIRSQCQIPLTMAEFFAATSLTELAALVSWRQHEQNLVHATATRSDDEIDVMEF